MVLRVDYRVMGAALCAVVLAGCGEMSDGGKTPGGSEVTPDALVTEAEGTEPAGVDEGGQTIIDIALASDRFDTLVTLVKLSGLQDDLAAEGPFTLFAPSNEAFAALPADVVTSLSLPQNRQQLAELLQYHVLAGKAMSEGFGDKVADRTTLTGAKVTIDGTGSVVQVADAIVTFADIEASNGVIHIIDTVILPPAE